MAVASWFRDGAPIAAGACIFVELFLLVGVAGFGRVGRTRVTWEDGVWQAGV